MSNDKQWIEKELSWLSFNERVLQEAQDKSVPLIERVRFLGIFSNNQDEFFKVRVAELKRRALIDTEHGEDNGNNQLLAAVKAKVMRLGEVFDATYRELMLALARHNIFLINESQISERNQIWLRKFFQDKVLRHISPVLLTKDSDPVAFLKDQYTYLAVMMKKAGQPNKYALIEVPTDKLPRFIPMPPRWQPAPQGAHHPGQHDPGLPG